MGVGVWDIAERLNRLLGRPIEDTPGHGGSGSLGPSGKDLMPGLLDGRITRIGQPGTLGQVPRHPERSIGLAIVGRALGLGQ